MTDEPERPDRAIEIEIEVPGTPEEIWPAIATGPGVSSWYVPHEIEQYRGGRADASFGPGPEDAGARHRRCLGASPPLHDHERE